MTLSPADPRPPLFAVQDEPSPTALYITLGPAQAVRIGTCYHCTVSEREKPARARDADGDEALDFDRETLLHHLETLGIQIADRHAYVCP